MTAVTVTLAALAVSLSCGSAAQAWPAPGGIDSADWCGGALNSDWACAERGSAFAAAAPLRSGGATRLGHNTAVWAEQGGSARVSLRNQARCTIGGGETSSEAITRPRTGVLLRQRLGDSVCTTPRRPMAIELCAGDKCIALLRAEGTALARIFTPEVTASLTESFYRRMRIVSCSGYVSVRAGNQFARGGPRGRNRYVVEIVESGSRTEEEVTAETPDGGVLTASANSESSALTIVEIGELPGRGPCIASSVREGERTVTS